MQRVLIVEDSPTQAAELRIVLESAGFEVEAAPDGEKGLAAARASRFDIVLSDIVMPGISGYELCRRIKSDTKLRDLPVVLLTTLSDPMDIIQGLECGADNFLTKPYDADYLLKRVGTLLENRRMRTDGKLKVGVEVLFLGKRFTVTSDKEQILDLLITTFEDIVRTNRQLQEKQDELARAKAQIEAYARRLEGEVNVTAEKYRYLMDHANDLIIIVDADGKILEINDRVEELLGRTRLELIGRDCLDLVQSEEQEETRQTMRALLERGGSQFVERHLTRRQGEPIPFEIAASVVDFTGERRAVLAIARDISERRRNEEALRMTEAKFRQSQKLEAIGRLAGGISHDFNNVLTAIQGYSELLLRKVRAEDRHDVEEVKKAAQRAAGLTRQLLAFSRSQVLQPVVLDLNEVMIDLEKMLRRLIGEAYAVESRLATGLGRVRADRGQVEQVVMNLVVNARDAMPGGGRIVIETADVELDDSFRQRDPAVVPGPYVLTAVTDSGCGMNQDVQARIFEPFFTTKEPGKGTGLGLSTVYGIVKQSGGHVWVYSEVGKGTTFKVFLPRVDEALAATPAESKGAAARGSETVLLAEDDDLVRDVTRQMLELSGYRVLAVRDGAEALAALHRAGDPIALLVSDVVMPGIGGRELARRARSIRPGLRILFLSGYTGTAAQENGELDSSEPFLQKPFTPDALARKVREALDESR